MPTRDNSFGSDWVKVRPRTIKRSSIGDRLSGKFAGFFGNGSTREPFSEIDFKSKQSASDNLSVADYSEIDFLLIGLSPGGIQVLGGAKRTVYLGLYGRDPAAKLVPFTMEGAQG